MQSDEEERQPGLKPRLISEGLRGTEGPLFHGDTNICDFFRKLPGISRLMASVWGHSCTGSCGLSARKLGSIGWIDCAEILV